MEIQFPQVEHAQKLATIYMAENDAIPRIDAHTGTVYHVACQYDDPMSCHSMNEMVCELLKRCGDGHGATRIQECKNTEFLTGTSDRKFAKLSKVIMDNIPTSTRFKRLGGTLAAVATLVVLSAPTIDHV